MIDIDLIYSVLNATKHSIADLEGMIARRIQDEYVRAELQRQYKILNFWQEALEDSKSDI